MEVLARLLEPDPRQRARSVAEVRELLDGRRQPGTGPAAAASETTPTDLAIPKYVQELAQTRKPLSIVVWLFALMAAAGVVVIEYAILPIVYLILRAVADNKQKQGEAIDDDKAGITSLREFRRSTTQNREFVTHVLRGTSPLRDDPPALPPGKDER